MKRRLILILACTGVFGLVFSIASRPVEPDLQVISAIQAEGKLKVVFEITNVGTHSIAVENYGDFAKFLNESRAIPCLALW